MQVKQKRKLVGGTQVSISRFSVSMCVVSLLVGCMESTGGESVGSVQSNLSRDSRERNAWRNLSDELAENTRKSREYKEFLRDRDFWKRKFVNRKHFKRRRFPNDPNSSEAIVTELFQSFDFQPFGTVDPKFQWRLPEGGQMVVTREQAFEGRKSLKIASPSTPTTTFHSIGSQFCADQEAATRFRVEFAIRFENFVSWDGIIITGLSDTSGYAYWWWVRQDGTVFDAATFDTLEAQKWYYVQIDIDRDSGIATMDIQGKNHAVKHEVPLSPTWWEGAQSVPMGCIRFWDRSATIQSFFVDAVRITVFE